MNELAETLRRVTEETADRLRAWPRAALERATADGWTARQILGHLIDSAAHNHLRFVDAQFKEDLVFPGYAQEAWVAAQRYESADWEGLVDLWRAYNQHLAHVIGVIPQASLGRPRHPHSLDRIAWKAVPADEPATLGYLIEDYLGHLNDHLQQLFHLAEA